MAVVELPLTATFEYLAEGAANIVYRFSLPPPSPNIEADAALHDYEDGRSTPPPSELPALHHDPIFEHKLLRLRKVLPSTTSVLVSQEKFEQRIRPLIPSEYLVQQTLVKLPPDLQADCNRNLGLMEQAETRPRKRHGTYLAVDVIYGSLVTDMTPAGNQGSVVIEFKPKWLAQSPSAPAGSRRCRTCALRAMRKASSTYKDTLSSDHRLQCAPLNLCPLDLVSEDSHRVRLAVKAIMDDSKCPPSIRSWVEYRLAEFFTGSPIICLLQSLQQQLDPKGILQVDTNNPEFLTATTLRDCTMFVVVPSQGYGDVHARLGDLDWKTPGGRKAEYWLDTERRLIDEGWYTGTEESATRRNGVDPDEKACHSQVGSSMSSRQVK
ncbi:MAG: hypothetical protein FRX48_04804 [Lasallia pustulata]|uniref:Inositol-pentakisphosphate 2-kinase n=1 Tax=Lasallia pustulata TaxID=136370 RepID=A0A5M8PPV2_9LECA|nr:MAG: hypothetical protein FRX48_04804 [Lasallia pustulata]